MYNCIFLWKKEEFRIKNKKVIEKYTICAIKTYSFSFFYKIWF